MQPNQQVTFLTDGGEDIRELPRYLNPHAEHLLDWFHLTMRITVLTQLAKGLHLPPQLSATLAAELQRPKWFLWHGNISVPGKPLTTSPPTSPTSVSSRASWPGRSASSAATSPPTPPPSPTTGNADSPAKPSPTSFVESAVNQVITGEDSLEHGRCAYLGVIREIRAELDEERPESACTQ